MEYEIGVTAGKVYQFLSSSGPAARARIKKGVKDAKSEVIDMAVAGGWPGKINCILKKRARKFLYSWDNLDRQGAGRT